MTTKPKKSNRHNVHQQDISAFEAFLQILRNGFVEAFNARYEQPPPSKD
ncbi:hypothetical protein QZH44_08875 [Pseudomonas corrugata]